jgi:predicted metal-binding membrane protein
MLKRIVEYGQLRRPEKIAGWTLNVLSAVCSCTAGFLAFRQASALSGCLQQAQSSPTGINECMAEASRGLGTDALLFGIAFGLFCLSQGCHWFGRRIPPVLESKDT